MNTLLLDVESWDLVIDVAGNIAMATDPYALAQDAASAIRLFQAELWYDTTQGVNYSLILGQLPPLSLLKQQFDAAALTVPGVATAKTFIAGINGRRLTGQVQISDGSGTTVAASF